MLWLYVIAVLLRNGPTYGYDVKRRIHELFGFKPATVTTYTVLYRLEREGLLVKDDNGLYRVTGVGEELYREALKFIRGTLRGLESSLTRD